MISPSYSDELSNLASSPYHGHHFKKSASNTTSPSLGSPITTLWNAWDYSIPLSCSKISHFSRCWGHIKPMHIIITVLDQVCYDGAKDTKPTTYLKKGEILLNNQIYKCQNRVRFQMINNKSSCIFIAEHRVESTFNLPHQEESCGVIDCVK